MEGTESAEDVPDAPEAPERRHTLRGGRRAVPVECAESAASVSAASVGLGLCSVSGIQGVAIHTPAASVLSRQCAVGVRGERVVSAAGAVCHEIFVCLLMETDHAGWMCQRLQMCNGEH